MRGLAFKENDFKERYAAQQTFSIQGNNLFLIISSDTDRNNQKIFKS